jgi:arylsulfatase A-like enzyme
MKKPNILLIFTDQQRADTIHALGNAVIRTPNLDRLYTSGTAFTSAYTPSPVCVPARCSMLYGQYPPQTKCYDNNFPMPVDGRPSFVEILTRAGYRTHGIGKCHYTPDLHALRGFQTREKQEEIVFSPEVDDYLKFLHAAGYGYITDPHGVRSEMYYIPQIAPMPAKFHPAQWVGDRGVAFLESVAHHNQPWYLFLSFIHPHPPFSPPIPWHKLYRVPEMPLPNLPPHYTALQTYINRVQNRYKYRDRGLDFNLIRCIKAYYYATISFVDFQIGRILDMLEKHGMLDRTMIIFTSDHGELLGDYGCFGKRSMHDACAKVPLLVRFPERFSSGKTCNIPVSLVDVAPTVLNSADIHFDAYRLDGIDLAEVANNASKRRFVFMQYQNRGNAIYTIITEKWKYAYSAPDNKEFLFDRSADPLETKNLAHVNSCNGIKQQLKRDLIEYLSSTGEIDAIDGDDWRIYPQMEIPSDPDAGLIVQEHPWAQVNLPPSYMDKKA